MIQFCSFFILVVYTESSVTYVYFCVSNNLHSINSGHSASLVAFVLYLDNHLGPSQFQSHPAYAYIDYYYVYTLELRFWPSIMFKIPMVKKINYAHLRWLSRLHTSNLSRNSFMRHVFLSEMCAKRIHRYLSPTQNGYIGTFVITYAVVTSVPINMCIFGPNRDPLKSLNSKIAHLHMCNTCIICSYSNFVIQFRSFFVLVVYTESDVTYVYFCVLNDLHSINPGHSASLVALVFYLNNHLCPQSQSYPAYNVTYICYRYVILEFRFWSYVTLKILVKKINYAYLKWLSHLHTNNVSRNSFMRRVLPSEMCTRRIHISLLRTHSGYICTLVITYAFITFVSINVCIFGPNRNPLTTLNNNRGRISSLITFVSINMCIFGPIRNPLMSWNNNRGKLSSLLLVETAGQCVLMNFLVQPFACIPRIALAYRSPQLQNLCVPYLQTTQTNDNCRKQFSFASNKITDYWIPESFLTHFITYLKNVEFDQVGKLPAYTLQLLIAWFPFLIDPIADRSNAAKNYKWRISQY